MQDLTIPKKNRALTILQLLWERFLYQAWQFKIITVLVIIFTLAWILIYYSTYVIWKLISWVLTKPVLSAIEWYLLKTQKHPGQEHYG